MSDYQSVAPTTQPVTLAEVKRQLNITSTADDQYLAELTAAASMMLENRTNRCFVKQTRVLKMDDFADCRYVHNRRIYPPRSPMASVTSISYVTDAGSTSTLPSSDYMVSVRDNPGFIAESYGATWPDCYAQPNSVSVTYVAGHSTVNSGVPANVKQAVKMVVGHWYRNREAVLTGTISKEIELGIDALLQNEEMPTYG